MAKKLLLVVVNYCLWFISTKQPCSYPYKQWLVGQNHGLGTPNASRQTAPKLFSKYGSGRLDLDPHLSHKKCDNFRRDGNHDACALAWLGRLRMTNHYLNMLKKEDQGNIPFLAKKLHVKPSPSLSVTVAVTPKIVTFCEKSGSLLVFRNHTVPRAV